MTRCAARQTDRVRDLNDAFRQSFVGGRVVVTGGTRDLSDEDRLALFKAVKTFDAFTPDNDPYGEHDFGSLELGGDRFFWKLDCYDLHCLGHSPDPADPSVTTRVLTIMRAEEY
ncbi:DUF3768 domain-containing protein [Sulfitobacter pseudonitzschiae]|uniref:DUF3768 domain-containing protein n=1 Tax=Pseudosulfitobacter pseudonitzschiae TaxID=1402135 RepID=A0A9Q2NRQ0_9RHOB|nr:DUF3768 domain-containing protein [Pseudosulfitobacter pseudonitzschiae]MBM2319698.1 DUF3768 domain-containing protein [Pseudosulfitobacter pseudonitzschiae]MBM2329278.1 DUF3768 domain-containing protein [Pseudosulfitobacter pseudonitzschiae]MBM2338865.1 DUF3768 domain-containing protein [Pseudosulfitobacter pseudonitzschiae]MBM2357812.1 DUF3768 domain-containing protein [Pseudosulfitobacter pseudonitzschiae]